MKKIWRCKSADPLKIREISSSLNVSPIMATLLFNRRLTNLKDAEAFLNPELSHLYNPFLLPDMEKAVKRVRQAIDLREKILVYGDRDADGVTALALLVRSLRNMGGDVVWNVPMDEGYGLHKPVLEKFAKQGVKLVITVDCGTSAFEEITFANSIGMEVVVTDHHLPPDVLPPAVAIVNPNLQGSVYPSKDLAGCLTAFKFAYAMMVTFNRTFGKEYVVLDLETTGLSSISDEIIEIGAVLIRNFVPIKQFHSLVKPCRPIAIEATAVHGITDEMVENSPGIDETLPRLAEFIGEKPLVAHNARFDMGFMKQAYRKVFGRDFLNPSIDTLELSRQVFKFPSHSLTALVRNLKIETLNTHRAMADCLATVALFQKIEEKRDPRLQYFVEDQMDLVVLGTIADVVPLLNENRTIVKQGLPKLVSTRKIGLRKLLEAAGIKSKQGNGVAGPADPTAKDIAWGLTPLINAAGRFSRADLAARLLLTDHEDEAADLVRHIQGLNEDRKNLQKTNVSKFLDLVKEQCDLDKDKLIFVVAQGFQHGVTGIVASHLVREFNMPAVLLILENGSATGSCRSIPGFNIVQALKSCEDLIVKYGGHPAAAGLTVELSNIEGLRGRLKKVAQRELSQDILEPQIEVDMELGFPVIDRELIREISKLEPFGQGNPPPVFVCKGMEFSNPSLIGPQKNHLKVVLKQEGKSLEGVGWGMGSLTEKIARGQSIDAAFELGLNRWNGRETLQLHLLDVSGETT